MVAHLEVEIIRRNRILVYADGVAQGAPQAMQVSDRWHVVNNLGDAVLRTLKPHHADVRSAMMELSNEACTAVVQLSKSYA